MRRFILEIIVFICGSVVMIFEIVGSRILGPYLGTSLFVWTSLIGIILGSLSLGYWYGGMLADKKPRYSVLAWILLIAAIFIGITTMGKELILQSLPKLFKDLRLQSTFSSLLLFAPTSILLGMVTPYAVRLKIKSIKKTGKTVGNLYAISTIGSIIGTFAAGFFLIPYLGSTLILYFMAFLLILLSILVFIMQKHFSLALFGLAAAFILGYEYYGQARIKSEIIDLDTEYQRVMIYESRDYDTKRPIKVMRLNNEYSSAMFLDSDSLVFAYTRYFQLGAHFKPDFKNTLLIGGAAYSYPKYYLRKFPDANIDVVEIDPMLTELAREHFGLMDDPRLTIIHQDGRYFINNCRKKYDVIIGDAYKSLYAIPFQLTTIEAIERYYDLLSRDGVLIMNIISSLEGDKSLFLQAEYNTIRQVFPQVVLFALKDPKDTRIIQSVILVALKSDTSPEFHNQDPELDAFLKNIYRDDFQALVPVLTDDHAPVEYFANKAI